MMDFLAQIIALCKKEFLAVLKDPSSRAVLLGPVLVQALIFGYGATYDLNHAPYAVLDLSHSRASTELLAKVDGNGVFERYKTLQNSTQVASTVESGEVLLVLTIPADFADNLAAGRAAPIQMILDGRNSSTAGTAAGYMQNIVANFNQSVAGITPTVTVVNRAWHNPNLYSRWLIMPALIVSLSLIQTLLLSALSVAREREQGTFDQLLVTPLTPMQILIGKALPAISIGLIQSSIILLIIRFWFEIPMSGSALLLYFGLFVFTCATVGIGLSISAMSSNMQQAMLYTFLIIMPLMLLSGLLTPVDNMPEVLQQITYLNPLRFGIDMVRRIYLEGADFSLVAFDFLPMIAVATVTLPLAAWLFRNRLA